MLPGQIADPDARFEGTRHHLTPKRVVVRTASTSYNLDPLRWSSHCGSHSGCLTSIIRHNPTLNAMPRATQGADIGRLRWSGICASSCSCGWNRESGAVLKHLLREGP